MTLADLGFWHANQRSRCDKTAIVFRDMLWHLTSNTAEAIDGPG